MNSRIALVVVALVTALHPFPAGAQEKTKSTDQDQVLRLKTELLQVRAVVTDKQGRLVDDLKQEDFEVFENDRPQRIEFFSKERAGRSSAGVPSPKEAAPTLVRPGGATTTPTRTVVLFVDTLHLSHDSLLRAKKSLKQFIREQLTDSDLAAIITSSAQMGLFNQFTNDRRILLYAVDRLTIGGQGITRSNFTPYLAAAVTRNERRAFGLALEILRAEEGYEPPPGSGAVQYVQSRARSILLEAASWRNAALRTLQETIKRIADLPGQRIIACISDGFSLSSDGGSIDSSELNKTINRAVVSGVVIYSLYGKGLENHPLYDASNRVPFSTDYFGYASGSQEDLKNGLNVLAKDTGGEAFFNTNDIPGSLKKVVENNEVYYVLAYYPESDRAKNKYRRISVRLKNHSAYSVRAQRGYLTADLQADKPEVNETPQRKLVRAITAPLPVTTIGVTTSADFLETDGDNAQATIQVHIDATTLEYKQQGNLFAFDLELVIFILDQTGKVAETIAKDLKGSLTAERVDVAKQNGLRFTTRTQLKPGQYQSRIGVRELNTGRLGTAMALLDVPDLKKKNVAMSGLFLSEAQPGGDQSAKRSETLDFYDTKIARGLPVFKRNGNLVCSFIVYNIEDKEQKDTEALMQLSLAGEGQQVYQGEWEPMKPKVLARGKKGLFVGLQVSLILNPGLYELQVRVKERKSKKAIQQSVLFEVTT